MTYPEPPSDLDAQRPSAPDSSFGEILTQFEQSHRQGQGESRQGKVVAISSDTVFVDIGWKTEGVLPLGEFLDASGTPDIKVGDDVIVSVRGRNAEGYYQLSKIKVERPKDWSALESAFAEKRPIAGVVTGAVKGGLSVDVGVRAFLPASRSGARTQADLEQLVGQEITCRIIKLDTTEEDVVVDRRAVLEEEQAQARRQQFDALQEGAVVRGSVRSLTDFGAFLDLGGIDGLLHVADIAWSRIEKPSDVLNAGDELEVKILKINRDTRKISLGLKQMTPDPWSLVEEKYKPGDRVRGKVTRLADFGAFVELEPGIEGLIRMFDLTWSKKARKPGDVVQAGELIDAVVLNVDAAARRIGLSLKQALGDPWQEAAKKFPAGSVAEGRVTSLAKFGAFVELAEGVEGMIHVGDISNEKRINHPQDVLKLGEVVKALVLEMDPGKRRARLGIKQLQPTSVDEYISEHKAGDIVTGRIVEVAKGAARVELGEGLVASCVLPKQPKASEQVPAPAPQADVSALSAMLTARWKQGKAPTVSGYAGDAPRTGQIRSFRIAALDPASKRIDLELAG
jgi:small subunit ribosomal protein S1